MFLSVFVLCNVDTSGQADLSKKNKSEKERKFRSTFPGAFHITRGQSNFGIFRKRCAPEKITVTSADSNMIRSTQ
jgi:hypothetical protein